MSVKKYRLLKELFNWSTGNIVQVGELFEQMPETRKYHSKNGWFVSEAACLNKDYFEEVLPVNDTVVQERIEVNNLWVDEVTFGVNPIKPTYHFDLKNLFAPQYKFPAIKQAIEDAINGKDIFDGERINRFVLDEIGKWQTPNREYSQEEINSIMREFHRQPLQFGSKEKTYTQSEVDTIRKEAGLHYFREGYKYLRATNEKIVPYDEFSEITVVVAYEHLIQKESVNLSSLNNSSENLKSELGTHNISENGFKEKYLPEQPSNDNAFVWDENTTKEYGKFCVINRSWLQWEDFKQSKQPLSTPIPDNTVDWKIECLVVGGKNYWLQRSGGYHSDLFEKDYSSEEIMKWPQFKHIHSVRRIKEKDVLIVGSTDYSYGKPCKILSFRVMENGCMWCCVEFENGNKYENLNILALDKIPSQPLPTDTEDELEITAMRRKAKNTATDKPVLFTTVDNCEIFDNMFYWSIENNEVVIHVAGTDKFKPDVKHFGVEINAHHYLKTCHVDVSANNDDVLCLSLNDVYHELKMVCDGTFGGIHRWNFVLSSEDTPETFYKRLEQKAKQKLSQ